MAQLNEPTLGHGKICYLQIPSKDIKESAAFYEKVFSWQIKTRDDGSMAFDDGVGGVSGNWLEGHTPAKNPEILISIMVDDAYKTVEQIKNEGGVIILPIDESATELTAHFADPSGNTFGIYQHQG